MSRDNTPMFPRGATAYSGGTIDTVNYATDNFAAWEGHIKVFEDEDLSQTGSKPLRTGRKVVCMCVRNVSAGAILPKRLVSFKAGSPGQVDGYITTTAQMCAGAVDEYLPSAGCPQYDLFWIVLKGPALLLTDLAGGVNNSIAADAYLTGLTAATSGATTAGRIKNQDLTGATAPLGNEVQNRIGRALSAKTTGQTNGDILVDMMLPWAA